MIASHDAAAEGHERAAHRLALAADIDERACRQLSERMISRCTALVALPRSRPDTAQSRSITRCTE